MRSISGSLRVLEFLQLLGQWSSGERLPDTIVQDGRPIPLRQYLEGWLQSDLILPTCWCQELDMSRRSTYAQAAKNMLKETEP